MRRNSSLLVLLIWISSSCAYRAIAQWPQFGGPNRDFQVASAKSENLRLETWSISLGNGDAAPVMDQNQIFVTEAAYAEDGQDALQVRCIDPRLGTTVWRALVNERSYTSQDISDRYPVRPMASPIAVGDKLVTVSYGGCVACLEQSSGRIVWQHDLVEEFQATPLQYGWSTSPWSDGTNVIVACGGPQCLVIAFDLQTGKTAWQSSPGAAAYGSFVERTMTGRATQLCYMGRDELVGLDPGTGQSLWSFPLPKPQLTNAVTPIALNDGTLLVAGQGMESTRRLRIEPNGQAWKVTEVWKSKPSPFYCNWLVDSKTQQLFGLHSNLLLGVDIVSGRTNWKQRGWTDANFAINGPSIVGVRGDGLLTMSNITPEGMDIQAGARVINDRVWAPPVVVGHWVLIRGRISLVCADLNTLPKLDRLPSGTQIDSMTAMYGEKHEKIEALLKQASSAPATLEYADYHAVVEDRANQFAESDYRTLLESLKAGQNQALQLKIAENWVQRQPGSLSAIEAWVELLRSMGDSKMAESILDERYVNVVFDVTVSGPTQSADPVYVAGNAAALGNWKPAGFLLQRSEDGHYRGHVRLPRGDLQFKLTQGTWEKAEVGNDGRKLSNRRRRIVQPTTIEVNVAAWSELKKQ